MTEKELDQHRADLQQLDAQDLRCGVMMQLHTIESLTAERDHWKDQHKECTRLLGEALQEATDMTAERDALKDAARLALDALVFYTDSEADDYQYKPAQDAIAALKAVL